MDQPTRIYEVFVSSQTSKCDYCRKSKAHDQTIDIGFPGASYSICGLCSALIGRNGILSIRAKLVDKLYGNKSKKS